MSEKADKRFENENERWTGSAMEINHPLQGVRACLRKGNLFELEQNSVGLMTGIESSFFHCLSGRYGYKRDDMSLLTKLKVSRIIP